MFPITLDRTSSGGEPHKGQSFVRRPSLVKPDFSSRTIDSSNTGREHDLEYGKLQNTVEEELAALDEIHVLFDEDNSVFEISLAHQNYSREEIWNEADDYEWTKAGTHEMKVREPSPSRIQPTADINGKLSSLTLDTEFSENEPTIETEIDHGIETKVEPVKDELKELRSRAGTSQVLDPSTSSQNFEEGSEMRESERDERVGSSHTNISASVDTHSYTRTHSEKSSVPLIRNVAVVVEPSPPRAPSQDKTETSGSPSGSDQIAHDDSSVTTKSIIWITLTPSRVISENPKTHTDAESTSVSHLQLSEDTSPNASKVSISSSNIEHMKLDVGEKAPPGCSTVNSSGSHREVTDEKSQNSSS